MDGKHLKHILNEIAREEIPDDMNLWQDIQSQFVQAAPRQRRYTLRSVRLLAAAALLIAATTVAYGFYQGRKGDDPGLEAVDHANMITYFDQTKELGGDYNIAVTLDYAYADANRITIAYFAQGEAPSTEPIQLYTNPLLTDMTGHEFTRMLLGGGGGGGGGASGEEGATPLVVFSQNLTASFDASQIEAAPDTLDLKLTVELAYSYPNSTEDPLRMEYAGQVEFEFSLPFNHGRVMDQPISVEVDGFEMVLQKVVIAPSMTRLEVCYDDPPPDGRGWAVWGRLEVDGEIVAAEQQLNETGPQGEMAGEDAPCKWLYVPDALQDYDGEWRLVITELRLPGSEDETAVIQRLKDEYGFEVSPLPDGGLMYDTNQLPEDAPEIIDQVYRELQDEIAGPWVFTFAPPK